jgi:hypothetical protein
MFADRLIQWKWSVLAPLLSALVLMVVLAMIRGGFAAGGQQLADPPPGTPAEAHAGQLDFIVAMQVQVAAILAAVVVGIALAWSAIRARTRSEMPIVLAILLLGAVAFTVLILDSQSPDEYDRLMTKTVETTKPLVDVIHIRLALDRITAGAATILAIATTFVLFPAKGDDRLRATVGSYRCLSYLLTAGTMLLASHVLTNTVLMSWAATYYPAGASRAPVVALGKSLINAWGVYDSLFLAATYIPAAAIVRTRLRNWGLSEVDPKAIPSWFDPKWLLSNSLEDIGRAAATLTPFIVGQAANLIGKG